MQLPTATFTVTLLTPCFSGTALGKYAEYAEIRIPPIRGHVRFWHRALFGAEDCNRVWGSTSGQEGHGSRVALRFVGTVPSKHAQPNPALLPHKEDENKRGSRPALAAGEQFTVCLQRLPACTVSDWDHAQRAVKAWLLLGGLGLRSNRAAGSVWPEGDWVPRTPGDLKKVVQELGLRNWAVAVLGLDANRNADALRETASDTIQGNPHANIFGSINPRKPSPTKFKVGMLAPKTGLSPAPCLIAVAPDEQTLRAAERLLTTKPNPGRWLALGNWNYI